MAQTHDPESIRKETKTYITVFIALAVLTVLTVGVSYFHLPPALAIAIALLIATFKGSLVAGFFMHLFHERKPIYWVLLLTVIFFLVLLFYPTISAWDQRNL
ncbi:MAG: cytochrome C oxidase subunit IV family protein [Thermoanaerobaculia bacterium]